MEHLYAECVMKETKQVFHILCECPKMAQTDYRKRHDKVAQLVHWNLCRRYGIQHAKNWYEHNAEKVVENEKAKILYRLIT